MSSWLYRLGSLMSRLLFCNLMDDVFYDLLDKFVVIYLDNIDDKFVVISVDVNNECDKSLSLLRIT